MGMRANYQCITDRELEKFTDSGDDFFEFVEELQENEECILCDIDKLWDVLHFVLTGVSASEPIEGNLLSEAVVGEHPADCEDFISYTDKRRVKAIAEKLNTTDIAALTKNFSMEVCKKHELYPAICFLRSKKFIQSGSGFGYERTGIDLLTVRLPFFYNFYMEPEAVCSRISLSILCATSLLLISASFFS